MDKKQQKYIADQAAVRTQPAKPVKRIEISPEAEQAARDARRKATLEKIEARRARGRSKAKDTDSAKESKSAGKAANGGKPKE